MPIPEGTYGAEAQLTFYVSQDHCLYIHELQTDHLFKVYEDISDLAGVGEAPANGQTYGRQDNGWTQIPQIPTAAGVVITTIQPASAFENAPVPITVNGTGFTPASVINWGGFPLATTFVDNTTLEATLNLGPGSSGIYTVVVTDGDALSNSVAFTVNPAASTLIASGASCTLNINSDGDLIITQTAGPNAGKSVNLTYGKWA
jgi:hypothetical protein